MAKKTLGYVRLEWTCPNCGTRNPGPQKTCLNCGYAQPEDVEFEQAAQEELIQDEAEIAQAQAGPDIHCYYCGTRNPAGAKTCSQCGADLSEGAARRRGRVVGAHRPGPAEPITCPACGAENDPSVDTCANCGASLAQARPAPEVEPVSPERLPAKTGFPLKAIVVALIVAVVAICGALLFFFNQSDEMTGRVESVSWQRDIHIEALAPVTHEDWRSEIPSGAEIGRCTQKLHHTQDQPAPNAKEICGTPYTVDTGSGLGEVVQDCQYEVYASWCEYRVDEWREADTITLSGNDLNPQWPQFRLANNQREREREETYRCILNTEEGRKTYSTGDFESYRQCEIGSRWILEVNKLNMVLDIKPAE